MKSDDSILVRLENGSSHMPRAPEPTRRRETGAGPRTTARAVQRLREAVFGQYRAPGLSDCDSCRTFACGGCRVSIVADLASAPGRRSRLIPWQRYRS